MNPSWEDPKPGFRWPVAVEARIAAPAREVWAAISMPGNLETCHPFCAANPVEVWPGERSRDRIHYLSGWVFERRFCRWIEGVGYDLEVGRAGEGPSFVSWRIRPLDPDTCGLHTAVYASTLQYLPLAIRWPVHSLYFAPRLRSYRSSVTQGFAWYVTRGERVPRNQFGRHPWFSAPGSLAPAPYHQ